MPNPVFLTCFTLEVENNRHIPSHSPLLTRGDLVLAMGCWRIGRNSFLYNRRQGKRFLFLLHSSLSAVDAAL